MLIDKEELTRSLNQKKRYTLSYLFPATFDIFRAATLPVTGLSLLELMGVFVAVPVAGLAITAALLGASTLLTSVAKTAITHKCENEKINDILALNQHPRLLRLEEKLKIINKSEEAKIILVTDEEYMLSDYLKNNRLSKILDDFFNYYDFIEENQDKIKDEYFKLNRKIEFLASRLQSKTGEEYASYLLPNDKLHSSMFPQKITKIPRYTHVKNVCIDTIKGAIFGASLAAFIIKLLIPTMIMSVMPYALAIYLPAIAVGITIYVLMGYLNRRSEHNAQHQITEIHKETEDKILALDMFVHACEFYENAPAPTRKEVSFPEMSKSS